MSLSDKQRRDKIDTLMKAVTALTSEMVSLKSAVIGGLTIGKASHTFADTTAWTLTDDEAMNVLLEADGTTGGATDIVALPVEGKIFIVNNNGTGSNLVIKASGETGVTVATGATTIVVGNGTDFVAVAS